MDLDDLISSIIEEEFPHANRIITRAGLFDETRILQDPESGWLAEVGKNHDSGECYRVRREPVKSHEKGD